MNARAAIRGASAVVAGLLLLAAVGCERPPDPPRELHIIPHPASVHVGRGTFWIDADAVIVPSGGNDAELADLAALLQEAIASAGGPQVPIVGPDDPHPGGTIRLGLGDGPAAGPDEGYTLTVERRSVHLTAARPAGLFYAIQTFAQLLPPAATDRASLHVPSVVIEDAPRFVYRGMHLDVGRHFFPVPFVKKYIDLLAAYKMNTFHWHLTEDQGWRIAIEKYPRLTEVGGYRRETIVAKNFDPYVGDGTPHGGFYTQDEIREIVAHARSRYVTVIPEIELPGHSSAALAAYPEFGCTDESVEVATRWGVFDDIYCPQEATFEFLEDVLDEVIDLFPGRYVHIGGDEAPKRQWEESAVAQEVIRREGLRDEHELQSWFIRRIEQHLLSRGRRLIGWDEILEGGLAPEATVMSWRGMAGGIEAARQGHDVIMTPTSHCYFDYYQGDPAAEPLAIGGFTPLEQVYAFEPVPDELDAAQARHVLGAQGNVWTEYMPTAGHVEYMVAPRLLALAEVVWSRAADRDQDRFSRALARHYARLDAMDVGYRVPPPAGMERRTLSLDATTRVTLATDVPGAEIRYAVDGRDDGPIDRSYDGPFTLPLDEAPTTVRAVTVMPSGRQSLPVRGTFARTRLRPAEDGSTSNFAPGLVRHVHHGRVDSVDALGDRPPVARDVAATVDAAIAERTTNFGLVFAGWIDVPADGVYRFHLTSDDGSRLEIAGTTVVDHDGLHATSTVSGMIALASGHHAFVLRYFQAGGGRSLRVEVEPPGGARMPLPPEWLFHRVDGDMQFVEGATFRMGTDEGELESIRVAAGLATSGPLLAEVPSHDVHVEAFFIDTFDVTNAQFARFVEANPAWRPDRVDAASHNGRYLEHWTADGPPAELQDHPLTFVTWHAAVAYCEWAGKRLPTEAEFEWAAQDGVRRTEYPWGDAPPDDDRVSWGGNGIDGTVPVGSYPPNPRGLHDMSGNVWHFTADPWRGAYADMLAGRTGAPEDPDAASRKVVRGGSWGANAANLRIRYRDSHRAFDAREMVGFRCARSATGL